MENRNLKVEVAQLPFQIRLRRRDVNITSYLDRTFKNFQSIKEPTFTIDVENTSCTVTNNHFPEIDWQSKDIKILKTGDGKLEVIFNDSTDVTIGTIDCKKKLCRYYPLPGLFWKHTLSPFIRFSLQAFLNDGFLIHACSVGLNGHGYIFPGPSGSGKTTIANLCKRLTVLSDEYVCITGTHNRTPYHRAETFHVWETPWRGKKNICMELKRIFYPRKGGELKFKKLHSKEVMNILMQNICAYIPEPEHMAKRLDLLRDIVLNIPSYEMCFSLNSSVSRGIRETVLRTGF